MAGSPDALFWLMTGEAPSGPFTIEQVHFEVAEGRATWQTLACPVGTTAATWRPLVQTSGIGPHANAADLGEPFVTEQTNPPPLPQPIPPGEHESLVEPKAENRFFSAFAQLVSWAIAAAITLGLFFGGMWLTTRNSSSSPAPRTTGLNAINTMESISKITPVPLPQPTPPAGGSSGWNLGGPPLIPAYMQDPRSALVGSWRWDSREGYASTFAFEASGVFTYYVTGKNAVLNIPVANCEAFGRWSVRDGTLFVEFTGASEAVLMPVFRGRTGRSRVLFFNADTVQLSGIEGDTVIRTYTRVR